MRSAEPHTYKDVRSHVQLPKKKKKKKLTRRGNGGIPSFPNSQWKAQTDDLQDGAATMISAVQAFNLTGGSPEQCTEESGTHIGGEIGQTLGGREHRD